MKTVLSFLFILTFAGAVHAEPPLPGNSVYNLGSEWIDQNGVKTKLESFRGTVTIVAMAFTSCQYACPLTIAGMKSIESSLPENLRKKTRFTVFSFDSVRDTPSKLKSYAGERHLDLAHWTLMNGTPDSVRALAAVLGVQYRKLESGDFSHSNAIFVLNQDGVITYRQDGLGSSGEKAASEIVKLQSKN